MNTQSAQPECAKPISAGFVNLSSEKHEPQPDWVTPVSRGTVGPSGKTQQVSDLRHTPGSTPTSSTVGSPESEKKLDWATPAFFGIMNPLGYTTEVPYALPEIKTPTPVRPHTGQKIRIPTPKGVVTFGVKSPPLSPGPSPITPNNKLADGGVRKRREIKTPPPQKAPSSTPDGSPNTPNNQLCRDCGIQKVREIKTPPPPKTPSSTPGGPPDDPSNQLADDGIWKVWEIKTPPSPKTRSPTPGGPPNTSFGGVRKRWEIKTPLPPKTPSSTPGGPPNTPKNQLALGGVQKRWEIKIPPPPKTPSPTPGGQPNTAQSSAGAFRKGWKIKTPPPPPKTSSPTPGSPPNTPSHRRGVKTPPPSPGPPPNTPSKRLTCSPSPPTIPPPSPPEPYFTSPTVLRMSKDGTSPQPLNPRQITLVKTVGAKTPPLSPGPPSNTPSKQANRQPREYAWTRDVDRKFVGLRGGAWPYDDDDHGQTGPSKKEWGVSPLNDGEKKKELVNEVEETVRAVTSSYREALANRKIESAWTRGGRMLTFIKQHKIMEQHKSSMDKMEKDKATDAEHNLTTLLSQIEVKDIKGWINSSKHRDQDGMVVDTVI